MPINSSTRGLLLLLMAAVAPLRAETPALSVSRPNILFIILDDVGKDLLAAFNPAAPTAALTPAINAIVAAGVKFTNFNTMPECSPSRVTFFTGRYPLRTGVTAAILEHDLPAAQISPFEVTAPQAIATAGYRSAMFGKYHLGGPENNPDGHSAPVARGWDYFNGNLGEGPPAIDVTLGGQYTKDKARYSCGFPTGAQRGAAWFRVDGRTRCDDNNGAGYRGQQALAMGGIPALDANGEPAATCREAAGSGPDFTKHNGYYVWEQDVVDSRRAQKLDSRQYMTALQTDAAIEWIREQSQGPDRPRPWMATVSFDAIHTPYQQPPLDLYPPGFVWPLNVPENCADPTAQRILSQLMLAAADREIARLLVAIGAAQLDASGRFVYRPEASDTMVIIAGDNGGYFPVVLPPYNPLQSKGTPYVTGVTTPLVIAGPLVVQPGRTVEHMVNSVDLFQLFAEIVGVNVRAVVPRAHVLDSEPVLPYLTNPNQPAIRRYSFTELGTGLKASSVKMWPCVLRAGPVNIATDTLITSQERCELNGGTWHGPTPQQPYPVHPTSCAIQAANIYPNLVVGANRVWSLRNARYKLVQSERPSCDTRPQLEFYSLAPTSSNPAGLDLVAADLLTNGQPVNLTAEQSENFAELNSELAKLRNSEIPCAGDGNLDKRVDVNDVLGVLRFAGQPSVFDFTQDGNTGSDDLRVVLNNLGNTCRARDSSARPR